MKFRTKYERKRVFTPVGSPEMVQYTAKYDDAGVLVLEESGKLNIYNEIQSHAESVDLNTIIRQYESGDVSVLSKVQGCFADVTQLPTTYAEMLNLIRFGEEAFDQLPTEIKQQFNNSFEQFFAQGGMELIRPESERTIESEEVTDES